MNPLGGEQPVLSICVPTYNRARYVECMLQDLAARIGELDFPYELLIGDNASEDNTAEVVNGYQGQLPIRYFRRSQNVGSGHNLSQLFAAARGRYCIYLADDDFLIPGVLRRYIAHLESHPEVGVVFAPWIMYDRVSDENFGKFYEVQETQIAEGDHAALFQLLVGGHVFPEIYVARTSILRQVASVDNAFAYHYFVQVAGMVDRAAATFSPEPFYVQTTRYFPDQSRSQAGIVEVKYAWDRYRGGLEYILSRFAAGLSAGQIDDCHRAIERFTRVRMHVGLRLRTSHGDDWVDSYYIANRLRSAGTDALLPVPYETYRLNAALAYLLTLQPFYPEPATVAYYRDDAPQVLSQAHQFGTAQLLVLDDEMSPLPRNTVLLTNRAPGSADATTVVVSEAELLARFP